jgi:hypothetical protein
LSFDQWVWGALFRPTTTYPRLKEQVVPGLGWILFTIFSIEATALLVDPPLVDGAPPDSSSLVLMTAFLLVLLHQYQVSLLLAACRWSRWGLSWAGANRVITLSWTTVLLEDLVTLPFALTDHWAWVIGLGIIASVWQLLSLALGLSALAGWSRWRALAVALFAVLPYRLMMIWLSWGG